MFLTSIVWTDHQVHVRQAEPEDAAKIVELWNPIIEHTAVTFTTDLRTSEGVAADIKSRGACFLVAEAGVGRLVGFATCFPFRSGPGYRYTREHTVMVAPTARGLGAGRALLAALETAAKAEGVRSLIAGISGENLGAVAFHSALGYTEVGRLPQVGHKFERWMDLILMQKFLQ